MEGKIMLKKLKYKLKNSLLPYLLVVVTIFAVFFVYIGYMVYDKYRMNDFIKSLSMFTYASNDMYGEYEGVYTSVDGYNINALGGLLTGSLNKPDKELQLDGTIAILYSVSKIDGSIEKMTFEGTENSSIVRVTLEWQEKSFQFDSRGVNYFDKYTKLVKPEGFINENKIVNGIGNE